ncbi:hypothetical protein [Marinicrinis sediminis]|uniref:Zinc ribbon domain-containing protein n=1 Tax=Marinicrinis sediminis TaxID=1652465 RepID=A0ABW5RDC7_9BACL
MQRGNDSTMKCPQCQSEEGQVQFCSQCGTRLTTSVPNNQSLNEKKEVRFNPGPILFRNIMAWSQANKRLLWGIAAPVVMGLGLSFLLSLILSWLTRTSSWMEDWIYRIYQANLSLNTAQSLQAAKQHGSDLWQAWIQLHGGTLYTDWYTYTETQTQHVGSLQYQLPFVSGLLVFTVLFFGMYPLLDMWGRKRGSFAIELEARTPWQRYMIMALQSLMYGLITAVIAYVGQSSFHWIEGDLLAGYRIEQQINFVQLWFHASLMFTIANVTRYAFGKHRSIHARYASVAKQVLLVTTLILFVVGVLIPWVWRLSSTVFFYEQPLVSIANQWNQYASDPYFWFLYPAFVIQACLFAIGGTWRVQGSELTTWLNLPHGEQHVLWGGSFEWQVDEVSQSAFVETLTGAWHTYAFIICGLFAIWRWARAKGKKEWKSGLIIGFILTTLLSYVSSIRLGGTETGLIGYSWLTTGVQVTLFLGMWIGVGILSTGIHIKRKQESHQEVDV